MLRIIALLLAALLLGADQLSKHWALQALETTAGTMRLPGPVDLTLVFNRSNAFGLVPVAGEMTRWGLAFVNLAVGLGVGWALLRRSRPWPTACGLAFIMAGAIGNAIDRIRFGAVIDFLNAGKLGFVWVFNGADAFLDIGIALLLLGMVLTRPVTR